MQPDDSQAAGSIPSYESFSRVLLLGEADYSFTRAFARVMETTTNNTTTGSSTPIELTATEYGSPTELASRYYDNDIGNAKAAVSRIQELKLVKEVICNLNARHLGNIRHHVPTANKNNDNNGECLCQRWNEKTRDWGELSNFWNDTNMNHHKTTNNNGGRQSSPSYDLIIFNFPHSDQAGRAAKLIRALFKQLRICIKDNRLPSNVVVEMRLRCLPNTSDTTNKKNIRSSYNHEQAARESHFRLIGTYKENLEKWEEWGYQHKMTKKNATCWDIDKDCTVWRWMPE